MTNLEQLLVTALRNAFDELNAIRARDGTPYHRDDSIPYSTEEYFSSVVEECSAAIEAATGEIPRPWGFSWEMSEAGSHAFIAALLNPPEPNEALKHAAEIYKKRIKSYEDIEHVSADTTSHATLASAISASIARIVAEEDEVARQKRVIRYNAIELAKWAAADGVPFAYGDVVTLEEGARQQRQYTIIQLIVLQNEMLDGRPEPDEVARLRAALAFYANPDNWKSSIKYTEEFILNGRGRRDAYYVGPPCPNDAGKIARAALETR